MVLAKVESTVAGCAILDRWLQSTMNQGGGRSYNRRLFGLPDRMLWVTGIIRFDRARELENWAMDAIAEAFPKFRVNKNANCLVEENFSSDRPNGSYFQAVRPYTGNIKQFDNERSLLDKVDKSQAGGAQAICRPWQAVQAPRIMILQYPILI